MPDDFKYSFKTPGREELALTVYNTGFQKCPPGYGWGPGVRDHYLLHYVLSGRGSYRVGKELYLPGAGELFLVTPDVSVWYAADDTEPWEYYWVGFAGPAALHLLSQTPFAGRPGVCRPPDGEALRRSLLEVYKARGNDYPSNLRMAGYLQAALALLVRDARGEGLPSSWAGQGADFFRRNYSQPIGVEECARHLGVSRATLYRAFQAELGCSPSDYLTRYRIQRSRQLLEHSPLPVGEVAASVGFADPLYFSRIFKRETGLSPRAYRESKS